MTWLWAVLSDYMFPFCVTKQRHGYVVQLYLIQTKLVWLMSLYIGVWNLQYECRSYWDGQVVSTNQNKMAVAYCNIDYYVVSLIIWRVLLEASTSFITSCCLLISKLSEAAQSTCQERTNSLQSGEHYSVWTGLTSMLPCYKPSHTDTRKHTWHTQSLWNKMLLCVPLWCYNACIYTGTCVCSKLELW